jgi:arylsulfatase A-like enzyme/Tfp pilus assembly protein PilF
LVRAHPGRVSRRGDAAAFSVDNRCVRQMLAAAVAIGCASCAAPPSPPPARPNVLLVTIDTLRADRLDRGLTPNLDALAARGTRYMRARTTVPLTLPSHTAILTGTLPPQNGVRENGDVLKVRPMLARAFQQADYRTGGFVGAYVLDRRFGLAGGFDTYDDRVPRSASSDARFEGERRGNLVADAALAWLQQRSAEPFFAWVHFYDPHAPYDPPQEYLQKAGGNAYDGEVAFADAQAGRLLEWLRTSGLEASTIVAVAADHGEGLGDHGEQTHGMLAYDSTLRVPLIVFTPGGTGRRVDTNVSLADLAGTLLQAAGVRVPDGMRSGPLGQGGEAYAETIYPRAAGWHALSVLAFDQWKVVLSPEAELYDLRADPAERHDLAGEKLATVAAARRRITELAGAAGAEARTAAPGDAAERLRAPGYVPGGGAAIDDAAPNPVRGIAAWNTFERLLSRLAGGDARGALPELTRLARHYPDAPVFQATYARALKETGRPLAAVELYRRLVSRWPRDAALYHDLAVAAQAAGMPAEAARAEQASLALQPSNAAAADGLGLLLMDRGATADAVRAFERATEDDPSNAVFWANLGSARRAAGDLTRAEQAYRHALDVDPRAAAAANGMGALLLQQKRAGEAIAWFERALAGSPRFAEARLNLGIACQESGHTDRAIEAYRRVLADAAPGSREYGAASQLLGALAR